MAVKLVNFIVNTLRITKLENIVKKIFKSMLKVQLCVGTINNRFGFFSNQWKG